MIVLAVPSGVRARQLYGLARHRSLPQPRVVEGWDVYDAEGLDVTRNGDRWSGTIFKMAVRNAGHPGHSDDDDLVLAGWERLAVSDQGLTELQVGLGLLLELDGRVGKFHWQRFTEILQLNPRPSRHNPAVKQLVALLTRARFAFDPDAPPSPDAWAQLADVEEVRPGMRTVRLDPGFRRELASATIEVNVAELRLAPATQPIDPARPEGGHEPVPNPEGNRASRWAMARIRSSILLELAPTRAGQAPAQELDAALDEGLLVKYGKDVTRVTERGHVPPYALSLRDHALGFLARVASGVVTVLTRSGSILGHVLRLRRASTAAPPQRRPAAANGHGPSPGAPAATANTRGPP